MNSQNIFISIYNMIVGFFSAASIDSSPVSTNSFPVLTDSSLLAFLLLDPPYTIQMHAHQ